VKETTFAIIELEEGHVKLILPKTRTARKIGECLKEIIGDVRVE